MNLILIEELRDYFDSNSDKWLTSPEDLDTLQSKQLFEQINEQAINLLKTKPTTEKKYKYQANDHSGMSPSDIQLITTIIAATATSFIAFLKYTAPLLVKWLRNRSTRELIITDGKKEIRLSGHLSEQEIMSLIENLQLEGDLVVENKYEISNSTIGMFNSGEIMSAKNIAIDVSHSEVAGSHEVITAIREIINALESSKEITSIHQKEILEQLQELSKQAVLPSEKRSSQSIIKALIASVGSSIGTAADVAQVWSTWGKVIRTFFGL